jgi:hypothetical protein
MIRMNVPKPSTNVVTFAASGTYTASSGMKKIDVYLAGGGGGGGGSSLTAAGTVVNPGA